MRRLSGKQPAKALGLWGRGGFFFPWAPCPGGDVTLTSNVDHCGRAAGIVSALEKVETRPYWRLLETISRLLISERRIS